MASLPEGGLSIYWEEPSGIEGGAYIGRYSRSAVDSAIGNIRHWRRNSRLCPSALPDTRPGQSTVGVAGGHSRPLPSCPTCTTPVGWSLSPCANWGRREPVCHTGARVGRPPLGLRASSLRPQVAEFKPGARAQLCSATQTPSPPFPRQGSRSAKPTSRALHSSVGRSLPSHGRPCRACGHG